MQVFLTRGKESREVLRHVLQGAVGEGHAFEIVRMEKGKPYFKDVPGLHFNLSHSGDFLLCALSNRPVGVDVECLRPRGAALPQYALTAEEYASYVEKGGDWLAFYTLWTKKEAWAKYTGEGLGKTFRQVPAEQGVFYRHYCGEGFCATVCGEELPPEQLIWLEE